MRLTKFVELLATGLLVLSPIVESRALDLKSIQARGDESLTKAEASNLLCEPGQPCTDTSKLAKRLAPRPGRRPGGGGNNQSGGNGQSGGNNQGSPSQGGSQKGGSEQSGGGQQRGGKDGSSSQEESLDDLVEKAYSDPGPGDLGEGRVPGTNKMPREVPALGGLDTGAPLRVPFERFRNWDNRASANLPEDSHFIFYRSKNAGEKLADFKKDFNNMDDRQKRRDRYGIDDSNNGRAYDVFDMYENLDYDKLRAPPGTDKNFLQGALMSHGIATRVAQQGGVVRLLADQKGRGQGPNLDSLNDKNSFWHRFEAWTLTEERSKVSEIRVHNAQNFGEPPVVLWRRENDQGGRDPVLGEKPDFSRPTVKNDDDDDMIDLDLDLKL